MSRTPGSLGLRNLRKQHGLTQKAVAELVQVHGFNCSVPSVWLAENQPWKVSDRMKARIREAILDSGYSEAPMLDTSNAATFFLGLGIGVMLTMIVMRFISLF